MSITIETIKNGTETNLFLDGEVIENALIYEDYSKDSFYVRIFDTNVSKRMMNFRFDEMQRIEMLALNPLYELDSKVNISLIFQISLISDGSQIVTLNINPDLVRWDNSFNFLDYRDAFLASLPTDNTEQKTLGNLALLYSGTNTTVNAMFRDENKIEFIGQLNLTEKSIGETMDHILKKVIRVDSEILRELWRDEKIRTVDSLFIFPESIKTRCEQYLLYFGEFLRDLGISATSDLKEEAGKVLFSIAPVDDGEALGKIREALTVYLNLPSSPIIYDDGYAAMRLQQQIENLQHSQKMAAREMQFTDNLLVAQSETIHEKNIIISQKDSTIEQQNRIIEKITSKSIMMDSLENKEEFEKLFDGLEFGGSKWLKEKVGIKFNPAIALKSLGGKLIGKDDEIITLNLDEPTEEKRDGI